MGAAAVVPDPTDVCAFGHQLLPGSDPITLKEFDAEGRKVSEETLLLRRHAPFGRLGLFPKQAGDHGISPTDPTRLIPYPCAHGLPIEEVPDDQKTLLGHSYGRAHWLVSDTVWEGKTPILRMRCPVCLGQPAPDWRA